MRAENVKLSEQQAATPLESLYRAQAQLGPVLVLAWRLQGIRIGGAWNDVANRGHHLPSDGAFSRC